MGDWLDRVSWPLRRYFCDLLIGRHAYSRNTFTVTPSGTYANDGVKWTFVNCTYQPFDQERSA